MGLRAKPLPFRCWGGGGLGCSNLRPSRGMSALLAGGVICALVLVVRHSRFVRCAFLCLAKGCLTTSLCSIGHRPNQRFEGNAWPHKDTISGMLGFPRPQQSFQQQLCVRPTSSGVHRRATLTQYAYNFISWAPAQPCWKDRRQPSSSISLFGHRVASILSLVAVNLAASPTTVAPYSPASNIRQWLMARLGAISLPAGIL